MVAEVSSVVPAVALAVASEAAEVSVVEAVEVSSPLKISQQYISITRQSAGTA